MQKTIDKIKRLCYNENNPSRKQGRLAGANSKNSTKSGFTIIEFSLATAFIAVLLITITIIASNIITIYQKGLTLKAVNSVGRGLVDELTNAINAAPSVDTISLCNSYFTTDAAKDACMDDRARNLIYQQTSSPRTDALGGETAGENVQKNGIFCTGNYSYIWNTYYGQKNNQKITLQTNLRTYENFRLIRVKDPTYRVCSATLDTNNYTGPSLGSAATVNINITELANHQPNVLKESDIQQGFLKGFDLDLDLYELTMFPLSQDQVTLRTFMSGTFVIATTRGNINIVRTGDYCDVNHLDTTTENATALLDIGSEFSYCAINKFNFAARTAGV